ncbi:MAG: V-type ATP synthase subunit E [Spirochaetaceae bacterium]|jgi:V/A-type H+-transporting ATPase subunit E|nr:V-type ATP synthase subunit E [Spirochaetaceae bacterium]
MDIQLQELIDKIKKEGIEATQAEVARQKAQAEAEAQSIIEAAKKEAEDIIAKGKADADRSQAAGKAALEQASRNLILAFKVEIENLLGKLIRQELSSSYTVDVLKVTLPDLLKAWAAAQSDNVDLIVSESDLQKLQNFFNEKIDAQLKKGITLKSSRNIGAGFHIAAKDGSAYYDFSDEAVAEMLAGYLNPRLAEILKTTVKKG